jgi:hypothetical protein
MYVNLWYNETWEGQRCDGILNRNRPWGQDHDGGGTGGGGGGDGELDI